MYVSPVGLKVSGGKLIDVSPVGLEVSGGNTDRL